MQLLESFDSDTSSFMRPHFVAVREEINPRNSFSFRLSYTHRLTLGAQMLFPLTLIATEDGGILLDIEQDRILKLNSDALRFWQRLSEGRNDSEIVDEISKEYGDDPELVRQDLNALKHQIARLGLDPAACSVPDDTHLEDSTEKLPNLPWYAGKHEEGEDMSLFLLAAGLFGIAAFDFVLSLFSMKRLCALVHWFPTRSGDIQHQGAIIKKVCRAVERACVWYWKRSLCLQRSAVTTCMLRSFGLPARLVIAAQVMPLSAHAWVELHGSVINDHKTVRHVYRVLARC
jgi:hypothetical protein